MNTHADKTKENIRQSEEKRDSQLYNGGKSALQYVDNRPEAVRQLKLQDKVNSDAQYNGGKSTFQFVDNRPEAVAQRKLQEITNNPRQSNRTSKGGVNHAPIQLKPVDNSIISGFSSWKDDAIGAGANLELLEDSGEIKTFKIKGSSVIFKYNFSDDEYFNQENDDTSAENLAILAGMKGVHPMAGAENNIEADVLNELLKIDPGGTIRNLILENTPEAAQIMQEYRTKRESGESDAMILKSILALRELQLSGFTRHATGMSGLGAKDVEKQIKDNDPEISQLVHFIDLQRNKEELIQAYKLDKEEVLAIEGYSLPNKYKKVLSDSSTNPHYMGPARHWGTYGDGWNALNSAMEKIPSMGQLGLKTNTFRVSRASTESDALKNAPTGTHIAHGYKAMSHGYKHIASSALTYSKFSTEDSVETGGGLINFSGTSGRLISPFSGQSTMMDGGEVLYPSGTMTKYTGKTDDGYKGKKGDQPVFNLEEDYDLRSGDVLDDAGFDRVPTNQRGQHRPPPDLKGESRRKESVRSMNDLRKLYGRILELWPTIVDGYRIAMSKISNENRAIEVEKLYQSCREEATRVDNLVQSRVWDRLANRDDIKRRINNGTFFVIVRGRREKWDIDSPIRMLPAELQDLIDSL